MSNAKKILITGASGLIGTRLTELLLQRGDSVVHLVRSVRRADVPSFTWDIENQFIDEKSLDGVDTIINLAGEGVAEKRWTTAQKQKILYSRTKSIELLYKTLKKGAHSVRGFISASGISYYGNGQTRFFEETDLQANDFLARVSQQWEAEAEKISSLGIRVAILRIGIVLSQKGGALMELAKPIRYFAGAPLGTGDQYMSWIHIDDLCGIFMKAIDDPLMAGACNAVAPHPVTNCEMTKTIAKTLKRPVLFPPVPGFALKLFLGEMADMVLTGSKVSSEKIQKAGYIFKFPYADDALRDLLIEH